MDIAKLLTPKKLTIAVSAVMSLSIMFMAFLKSGDEEYLPYVMFGIILFGADLLLCETVAGKHSAIMAAAFVFLNTTGIAMTLLNGSSMAGTLCIIVVSVAGAFLFFKLMRKAAEWTGRSKRNTVITLTVIFICMCVLYSILFLFPKINNARAWIVINAGGHLFTFQVTEITKLLFLTAVSIIFASPHIKRQIFWSLVFLGINILFLCIHNELGTAFVMAVSWLIIQFIFTGTKHGLVIVFVSLISAMLVIMTVNSIYGELGDSDTQNIVFTIVDKIHSRLFPEDTYQMDIALESIVNGGIFGASSDYILDIPVAESDYAFANLCQRFGALFGIVVIASFILIVFNLYQFLDKTDFPNYELRLSLIFTVTMTVQMIIIIFTNTGILATIGICAPFISEGGSQCVITYAMALYIVSSMSPQAKKPKIKRIKRKEIFADETELQDKNKNHRHSSYIGAFVGSRLGGSKGRYARSKKRGC